MNLVATLVRWQRAIFMSNDLVYVFANEILDVLISTQTTYFLQLLVMNSEEMFEKTRSTFIWQCCAGWRRTREPEAYMSNGI